MRIVNTVVFAVIMLTATISYAGSGDLIVNGNLGVGGISPTNKFNIMKAVGTNDYANIAQHNMQFSIANGLGIYGTKTFEIGILDNGTGIIQANESNVGYNPLALNPVSGNVGIGTTTPAHTLDVNGTTWSLYSYLSGSDIKLKKNLLPIQDALNTVLKINGVSYEWNDQYNKKMNDNSTEITNKKDIPVGRHYGVIAQDIEKILPEVVVQGTDGLKAVYYTEIIPILIEAIKEQQAIITNQQKQIDKLGSQLSGSK